MSKRFMNRVLVPVSLVAGAIALLPSSALSQTLCGKGTLRAAFETTRYQLTVCQDGNTLFLLAQQKTGKRQLLKMPAFYNPETQVFGGVRTIPNPGAAYAYDLNPAITTVYYIQDKRLYVLENGTLVANEAIAQSTLSR
jgi:hypothetical protein